MCSLQWTSHELTLHFAVLYIECIWVDAIKLEMTCHVIFEKNLSVKLWLIKISTYNKSKENRSKKFDHQTVTNILFQSHAILLITHKDYRPYSKSKLELESTSVEFCRLIKSLLVALPQLNLKLEYLKLVLSSKKKKGNTYNFFASLKFDFFLVQLKFAFIIRFSAD